MSNPDRRKLHQQIDTEVKAAVVQALERHRKLGESIAIWQEGKVMILSAEEIRQLQQTLQAKGEDDA